MELLKTKSKEEYDYEKLQRQQDSYLGNMWKKVDNEIYQHSIYYETTRLSSYADFEGMEFFPEIFNMETQKPVVEQVHLGNWNNVFPTYTC